MPHPEHKRRGASAEPPKYKEHNVCWPKGSYGGEYLDWRHYKANGANLGSWLWKEKTHDPLLWRAQEPAAAATADEWNLCLALGDRCGPVLEERYESFLNTSTIDQLASVGINTLRIPTSYAAWVDVPGSALYHGNQKEHLRRIANYAIDKYHMHVIVGLHSLPGGVNPLDIGEGYGHIGWFQNATNLDWSLKAWGELIDFVVTSDRPNSFSISPINEAADNMQNFGTAKGLSEANTNWVLTYIDACIEMVEEVDRRIPIVLQDSFKSVGFWEPLFDVSTNLVMSPHLYYFSQEDLYAGYVNYTMCGTAQWVGTFKKFPVMVGEWSIQVHYNNTFADRKALFDTQKYAYSHYSNGATFWTAVSYAEAVVSGEGTQRDYWSYIDLINAGVATKHIDRSYC
ncbi:glycoside hydrolase superfamily [Microdochium trichocladiopsis]|uniref:glucan 1,3-beta-glucosidase n=1 Tax=Microdochium trichocladiopsis TaxID=1682393 RepID=A0A9P8XS13_9PEZI|nr:glycoside hydrolase superfamily [Microdochium trichocladiopsis]KAH7014450.1 glycoside hydrolase superfamily [Microdochium trichocladiopsis]